MEEETLLMKKEEKKMRDFIPVFSEAFGDAALLVALNLEGKQKKKWEGSEFYFMCVNAEKLIFRKSAEVAYKVRWSREPGEAERYEIAVKLKDGRRTRLLWQKKRITIELSDPKGKATDRRTTGG